MVKGTTVFERWRERRRVASLDVEEKFLNPLDVRIRDIVTLDLLDLRELDFEVSQFRVITRKIGDREFPLVDYFLLYRGLGDQELRRVLRFIPLDEPDPDSDLTHLVLLLEPTEEMEYSQDMADVLAQNEGYTTYVPRSGDEPGETTVWDEISWPARVNDIVAPYECDVDLVRDKDHDGEVEDDEVESHQLTYWDFWRLTSVEGGEDMTEFLFIEVDTEDGWTELFQGVEIDPAVVTKL